MTVTHDGAADATFLASYLKGHADSAPATTAKPAVAPGKAPDASTPQSRLIVGQWLSDRGIAFTEKQDTGRTVYAFDCVFNPDHRGEASITQHASGAVSASCFHNSCSQYGWAEFKEAIGKPGGEHYDPPLTKSKPEQRVSDPEEVRQVGELRDKLAYLMAHCPGDVHAIRRHLIEMATPTTGDADVLDIGELIERHPALREPVVDGLIRRGETVNIVSSSKVGKSWMIYGLLLAVVMGWRWLGRFPCHPGRVLLIDNELHKELLASRLQTVAHAMQVPMSDILGRVDILPLRGRLKDIAGITAVLSRYKPGDLSLVVIDALYRVASGDENSNRDVTQIYNAVDQLADRIGAGVVLVHHASKGNQTDKAVTDVGSGAGAQSRAADAHIVLRPHKEDGAAVLDAALRSFAPIEPLAIRFEFPLWESATDLDPAELKRAPTKGDQNKESRDGAGFDLIVSALRGGAKTERCIRGQTRMGKDRNCRLLQKMVDDGRVTTSDTHKNGQECVVYSLADYLQTV